MQVIKGASEAEVKIFGSVAVQNKAKVLIDETVVSCEQSNCRGGSEKFKKCIMGGGKKTVGHLTLCW